MRTAIIDAGGGQRAIYACGVLDYCMKKRITFDVGIGVSAGSANLSSFIARQKGRNYRFYTEFALRDDYMGIRNVRNKGCVLDLDYIYGTLSNKGGDAPLNYAAFRKSPMDFIAVATEAVSGGAKYFSKSDLKADHYDVLKASCAIPHVCKPQSVNGIMYYDGALSDPLPVELAFSLGCKRAVLLLSQPFGMPFDAAEDNKLAEKIRWQYPEIAKRLLMRSQAYQKELLLAQHYAQLGKLLIVAPDDDCGVTSLSRDTAALEKLYEKGLQDGQQVAEYMQKGTLWED